MGCIPSKHSIPSSTTATTNNTPERSEQPAASRHSTRHASSRLSDLPRRNLEISRASLTQIRAELYNNTNFKSSNKTNLKKPDDAENQRIQLAADEIDDIRSDANVLRSREAIWEARGHNCGDLAMAAQFLATDAECSAHVAGTSVHEFAVIGDVPSDLQLPDHMENWPEHLAVCD